MSRRRLLRLWWARRLLHWLEQVADALDTIAGADCNPAEYEVIPP